MKAFNVSTVLFFFCLNIFDPNCFLIGVHIDEKHFLIPAQVAWMIKRKDTAYVLVLKGKKSISHSNTYSTFLHGINFKEVIFSASWFTHVYCLGPAKPQKRQKVS